MNRTVTYDQALNEAAQIFADARARRDSLPADQAAREAWVPGGPSVTEITALINRQRAQCRERRLANAAA
ncbi:hypothetical protein [Microbispora sp. KK1-11]|uniref:hypothetical protein n=1 Tax=Microbispora sp. KK1-11 TaxID=2053005 RepID=UPI00163CEAB5|nr:hypothetical protein [Microbispora sp. KK1-11]